MPETTTEVIQRYLEGAIAAEKTFETQLQGFAKDSETSVAKSTFQQHARETKRHHERLAARLEELGGGASAGKSMLAHLFDVNSKADHSGHARTTQNLIMAFAVENSGMAMYESLAAIADAAGDSQTATLAREIQTEDKTTADSVWNLLGAGAAGSKP